MSQIVQGVAALGYVANNSRSAHIRDVLYGHLDRAAGALGGGDIVLPAAGGLAVSPIQQRRVRSSLTPDVKRVRLSTRISPRLANRVRSRLNRRVQLPRSAFVDRVSWFSTRRRGRGRFYKRFS